MGFDRQTGKSYSFFDPEKSEVWYNSVAFASGAQLWSEPVALPDPCGVGSLGAINTQLHIFFQKIKALKAWGELYINGANIIIGSQGFNLNVWTHFSLVRSSNTVTMYVAGQNVGTATVATSVSTHPFPSVNVTV